jgi:anti-sigma regulatory factor (Ser/Thr protein kinase)
MGAKERLDLRVPARPESIPDVRREVVAFAKGHGAGDPHSIALAVTEAAANAVVHAYRAGPPGDVRVVVCAHPDRLEVVVRDWGGGLSPRPDSPGLGLGLPMIASLASDFRVEAASGTGTLIRMQFERTAAVRAA